MKEIKEEAVRLVNEFYCSENIVMGGYGEVPQAYFESAKACAIVCAKEIMKVTPYKEMTPINTPWECCEFWEYVINEIEKLKLSEL